MARRAEDESKLFPESKIKPPNPAQAARISSLAQTRDDFSKAVLAFSASLKDSSLSSDRSVAAKEQQKKVLEDFNFLAGELEKHNPGEGIFSLMMISLNSMFSLRDEINDVKFQNLQLYKKLKALEQPAVVPANEKTV